MVDNLQRKKVLVEAVRGAAAVSVGAENPKIGRQSALGVLEKHFKNDIVITEGASADRLNLLSPAYARTFSGWIFDLLTSNGEGTVGVSLAYVESGLPILAAVYNSKHKEFFSAEQGSGAQLNSKPIRVASGRGITHDTRVYSSHSKDDLDNRKNLERFLKLNPIPKVLFKDCPALAIMEVACGRADLYHYIGLKPWDNAAAFLVAQEAGAKIVDPSGKPASIIASRIVMGSPTLVDDFVAKTQH